MEKGKFEDKWKDAFRDGEISPSENVWTNIELDLERDESGGIKRKLLFYQSLAAASVIFALAVGGTTLYFFRSQTDARIPQVAQLKNEKPVINKESSETTTAMIDADQDITIDQKADLQNPEQHNRATIKSSHNNQLKKVRRSYHPTSINQLAQQNGESIIKENKILSVDEPEVQIYNRIEDIAIQNDMQVTLNAANLPSLKALPVNAFKTEEISTEEAGDPVALMLAKLDQREKEIGKPDQKKKRKDENLWTSVGVAAGSFNSSGSHVSPGTANAAIQTNSSIATKEAKASGSAYTVGVNMGKKISNRWIVQGGVNYLAQQSVYTAQTAVTNSEFASFRPESINELNKLNQGDVKATESNKVVTTAPYNVNNNVRYLSVPIQAGYMLVNKKFGFQFNAGLSTDLFLNNTKTAQGQTLDRINQGIADDSPYRSMNFSGLVGSELSYKFSSHYRVALNPGVHYPLNSVYKTNIGVQSAPLTFDVGLRFRYIFH
jgi:hypothetical protein